MDITYIPPERQGMLLLYSIVIGFLSGTVCGIVRIPVEIIKYLFPNKKIIHLITDVICDVVLSLLYISVTVIFIYAANEGVIRYFLIIFAFAGFILCRITLGKLYNKLSYVISKAVNIVIRGLKKLIYPITARFISHSVEKYIKKGILKTHGS